jgi:hypothetical protein
VRHLVTLFIPTFACVVVAMASSGIQRRLRPETGAAMLTGAALAAASAVILALGAVGFAFLSQITWLASAIGWCRTLLPVDDHVPTGVGVVAIAVLTAGIGRAVRFFRRSSWRSSACAPTLVIVDSAAFEAVAVPGDPNYIVVSSAMMGLLDDDERAAMLAHERSHIDNRHHRYLVLAGAAAAAVPLVRPIAARVRYCTERWADESAAQVVGDRTLVARTIAKAALARSDQRMPAALHLLGIGVPGRVAALLGPPRRSSAATAFLFVFGVAGLLLSLGASTVQLHHLIGFAIHVCGSD